MDLGYKGQVCVVTGGSGGMGSGLCKALVAEGAVVYNLDVKASGFEGVIDIVCELSTKAGIDAAFAKLPDTIHKFWGIAGVSGVHHNFKETLNINYTSNMYMTETYLNDRIAENGAIIYLASVGGFHWREFQDEYKPLTDARTWEEAEAFIDGSNQVIVDKGIPSAASGIIGYVISKRALIYYSKVKAAELGKAKGVRVNTVSPGITASPLVGDFQAMARDPECKNMLGYVTRFAESIEQSYPMLFLNSDCCSYVSCVDLAVDFGHNGNHQLCYPAGQEPQSGYMLPKK